MSDQDLREHSLRAARDLERDVALPDFGSVAARGRRTRRRRAAVRVGAAAAAVAAAVAGAVAVGFSLSPGADRTEPGPVGPDHDQVDRSVDVTTLLGDSRAVVDDTVTAVSDDGAVLQRVSTGAPGDACAAPSAWVWTPWSGTARSWADSTGGRRAAAVPGGLVVSAPDPDCGPGDAVDGTSAYVVDAAGQRATVTWEGGADRVCARDLLEPRCALDVASATGRLQPAPGRPPAGSTALPSSGRSTLWAGSLDSRTLHWSRDGGRTWQTHRTTLPTADDVQVTAAGDWAVFWAYPVAEYTRDAGRSWQRWDGSGPLARFLVANEQVVVSADGDLVVVDHRPGHAPRLLATTDSSWQEVRAAQVRTGFGTVTVSAAGGWFWVPDRGRTWVSPDGLRWHAVDPLTD